MEFRDFLKKANSIYEEFRDTSRLEAEGLAPNIPEKQGGYLVAYRHSDRIADAIGEFSERVSKIVPSIKYNRDNAHVTISGYQLNYEFIPDNSILKGLSGIVRASLPLLKAPPIEYQEWLLNQNTGIAAGIPKPFFLENAETIKRISAEEKGIQLRLPWGAHSTVNRFLKVGSKEDVRALIDLFKTSKPLGTSTPNTIDVGYFDFTPRGLILNTYERFEIK